MKTNRIEIKELPDSGANRALAVPVNNITRTGTTTAETPGPRQRKNKLWLSLGLLVLLPAAVCAGYGWWDYARTWVTTNNAYVSGHVHTVSPRIAGTVTEVLAGENRCVAAGEVLARLDPNDLKVQAEKARATFAQAEAQLSQARAQVTRDQAFAAKAQLDFERADRLFRAGNGVISKAEFDSASAGLDSARGGLAAVEAGVLAAEAQVKVATAQLQDAELQLSYTEILAPAAGVVGRKNVEVGNRVQPGQSLLAVVQSAVWVTANFKETQLKQLRAGQTVSVVVDAFPGHDFIGRVASIAPASGAQFALLPPDNATGNFTKIVQRVPVKIVFDDASTRGFQGRIVPGMSVVVKVNVRG